MSVTNQTPIGAAIGNGVTTVFPFSYYIAAATDLVVKLDGVTLTLGAGYTVAGAGSPSGGTITLAVAPAIGARLAHFRDTALIRATDYQDGGDLLAPVLNLDFDRLWLALQEIFSGGKGAPTSVRVPAGETIPELPAAAARANRLFGFDSLGQPIATLPAPGDATALALDLASTATATQGAGQIGFLYSLAYGAGTIGRWLKDLALSAGSSFIGWIQAGTGAVTRTLQSKLREQVSLTDFGADPTGATDSAAAITAWLNYCYANNVDGYAPPGTYLTSTGHTVTYTASRKFQIRGAGRGATNFRKTGANTGAVFKFTISSGDYLELNLHLQDFEVDAPSLTAVNGIEFDAAALVTMSRVRATNCFIGMEAKGLLVSEINDCDFTGNEVGMRFRRGLAGSQPYSNAVTISNCRANANRSWGLDFGEGSGLLVRGVDIESGGTTGNVNTGGIIVRSTIDDESGSGYVSFDGVWLEANKGRSFYMESSANSFLGLKNVKISAPENGQAIRVEAIRSATFENVLCLGASSELTCVAELQNYLGNVYTGIWSPSGSSQITGAVKTAVANGDIWEASKARVGAFEVSASVLGTVDGAVSLGSGARRFNTVFATTGAINTSDEREKTPLRPLAAAERAAALAIKSQLGSFKFLTAIENKGSAARWHFGAGAQTVAAAFQAEGLDPHAYGLFCYDEWPATDGQPAGNRYGVRYDELAMFILAAS
jgi:hypothetical protein